MPELAPARNIENDLRNNPAQVLRELVASYTGDAMEIKNGRFSSTVEIIGKDPGPQVSIFGGIHGDEMCGVLAVQRLLQALTREEQIVEAGQLHLVIGNEEALKKDQRASVHNLNRLFLDDYDSPVDTYEERRAQELMTLLRSVDFHLDIHSTFRPTKPYLIAERAVLEKAKEFGSDNIVTGWSDLASAALAGDTEAYCVRQGGVAFTLECGQHTEAASKQVAYTYAEAFLRFSGLSKAPYQHSYANHVHELEKVEHMPEAGGFAYHESIKAENFEPVSEDQVIGYGRGRTFTAPFDGALILPKDPSRVKPGGELYILAKTGR